MKIKITNIVYDTDGKNVELPQSLEMTVPDDVAEIVDDGERTDQIEGLVSDFISDTTGWCHKGFDFQVV